MKAILNEIIFYIPLITIFIGVIGYFFKSLFEKIKLNNYKKLEYLEKQINEFYGPLYILSATGKSLFDDIWDKFKKNGVIENPDDVNPNAEWRLWVEEVFIPLNNKIEKVILEKGYLSVDEKTVPCFTAFLIYNAQCKILVRQWSYGDFSNFFTKYLYPPTLSIYVKNILDNLKLKQQSIRIKLDIKYEKIINNTVIDELKAADTGMKYLSLSSSNNRNLKKAKDLLLKKDYLYALCTLYFLSRGSLNDTQKSQLWELFNDTMHEFYINDDYLFYNCLDEKKLIGMVNTKVGYHREDHGVYYKISYKNPKYILFKDKLLTKPIDCILSLYDEVDILEYDPYPLQNSVKTVHTRPDIRRNAACNIYYVRTQNGNKGWIAGYNLWFFPTYAKNNDD